jgi:formylglycine-generating enzyme required for sulfatase activity
MGLFDFLFESQESKAERIRQEEQARLKQERIDRVNWFKQQARIEKVSIFKNTIVEFCYVPPGQLHVDLRDWVIGPFVPKRPEKLRRITRGYWLSRTPITQGVWKAVTGKSPSSFEGNSNLPVESVSWDDCSDFVKKLDKGPVLDGVQYRFDFPTEAQWEYACRAGTSTNFAVEKYCHRQDHPSPVGQLPGNALGLQDMHGNVEEWCRDIFQWECDYELPVGDDPCLLHLTFAQPEPPAIRPRGWTPPPPPPAPIIQRVLRGGSWFADYDSTTRTREYWAQECWSGYANKATPDTRRNTVGFRLALVAST